MAYDPFAAFPGSVVLDGGLASELERNGADLRDPLWSAKVLLDEPGRVVDVHRAYVEAGAQVVIGASYQASFEGLARRGFDRRAAERVLASSVELAREGAAGRALVAASIGPYGAFLANGAEYTGDYRLGDDEHARAALHGFHLPRAEALAAASPDLFAVETIPSLLEADVLVQVLHEIGDVPAWVSFSCRDDMHLCDGSPIEDAVDVIDASPQVIAIGVNCTPPAHVPGLLRRAATRTERRLVAYPNRGAMWDASAKTWTGDAVPDGFGTLARGLADAGATLIGGCCGTGPDDIRDVAAAIG